MRWDRVILMAQVVFCFASLVLIPGMLNRLDILLDLLLGEAGSHLRQCDRYFSGSKGALRIHMTGAGGSGIFRAVRVSWAAYSAKLWYESEVHTGKLGQRSFHWNEETTFREKSSWSPSIQCSSQSLCDKETSKTKCAAFAEPKQGHGPSTLVTCVCWKMGRNGQFMAQPWRCGGDFWGGHGASASVGSEASMIRHIIFPQK